METPPKPTSRPLAEKDPPVPPSPENLDPGVKGYELLSAEVLRSSFAGAHYGALINLTLNQLRTLVLLKHCGSKGKVARFLGNSEQSGIKSQIETLNAAWKEMCGTVIGDQPGRGEMFSFTPAGEAAVAWANTVLATTLKCVPHTRELAAKTVIIATTTFTLPLVARVWEKVQQELGQKIKIHVRQIKTTDFWRVLEDEEVDLVAGAIVVRDGQPNLGPDFEMIFWSEDRPGVLTRADNHEFSGHKTDGVEVVDEELLAQQPLIMPTGGIIVQLIEQVFPNWKKQLNCKWQIEDVYYGTALLTSGIARGSMVVLESVSKLFKKPGTPTQYASLDTRSQRVPVELKYMRLGGKFEPLRFHSGLFVRKARLRHLNEDHPVKRFWNIFAKEAHE